MMPFGMELHAPLRRARNFSRSRTGRTIASNTEHGFALQNDGGLASRLGIRGSDPELH